MSVTQETLRKYKWSDLSLRPYQLEGVNWLLSCYDNNHGCILSDEMGLGKTCQIIAMLTVIKARGKTDKQHLIVCPRSVLENWELEIKRFSPALNVVLYIGEKEARNEIAQKMKSSKTNSTHNFDILLTTYEMCLKDSQFISSIAWDTLIVDEGHRLKNSNSLLYTTLEACNIGTNILLTGTPLQNNLTELYSLLSFVDSSKFKLKKVDKFVDKYSSENKHVKELHELLSPYILRRTKANVLQDLPEKNDVILYHGLSALQKKLYKAILTKDIDIFESTTGSSNQSRLINILIQLRKCVNHPYLFNGVEPEPFELGEHLVEASHKLTLIDHLLTYLKDAGHKVLLFSQMTHMLDIIQDYLVYRGYTYERLDGSVRGEERFLAVQNFNANDETFVFLLSTKAGGQGLNLTSADTVIFVDSDFNPQNDLQAAARAHRIGQERPVKIIRLVGRKTVEEIILHRAEEKLKLTEKVIDSADFTSTSSSSKQGMGYQNAGQLREILKFGVDELLADGKTDEPVDFEAVIGSSRDGQWVVEQNDTIKVDFNKSAEERLTQSMYVFEGTDYSKEPSAADIKAFEQLIVAEKEAMQSNGPRERPLRKINTCVAKLMLPLQQRKPRKQLTPQELEERKKKNQEAAERRALRAKEQELAKAEAQIRKREALWKANKYVSANISLDSGGEEEDDDDEHMDLDDDDGNESGEEETSRGTRGKKASLRYVIGDVTHPLDALTDDNIIVHCVDNSGTWGRGGLFSAISSRSEHPESQYELAGKMKDLTLGDCHLIPVDDIESRESGRDLLALVVSQDRDKRTNKLSGIKLPALELGLQKIYKAAKERKASVHLPRIGHDMPGFNWYGTERLLKKHLSYKGIPTFIYYFPRKQAQKRKYAAAMNLPSKASTSTTSYSPSAAASSSTSSSSSPTTSCTPAKVPTPMHLPALFSGIGVYFHNIPHENQKKLTRFLLAYDGDVEKHVNNSTTHLITDTNTNKLELNDLVKNGQCSVVTQSWLEDCVTKGRLLPTEDYLIPLA